MFRVLVSCGLAASLLSPAWAAAQATAPAFRSAFESYQPFTDQEVAPWKRSNDTVGEIGGWRAYAREAAAPEVGGAGAPPAAAPAAPPASKVEPAAPAAPAARPAHRH